MSLNDPLSNVLSNIYNAEKRGKRECRVTPSSKLAGAVLTILKDNNYISDFKEVKDARSNYLVIGLQGSINRCGVIKPRFSVTKQKYEMFEKRYLLAKDFGIIVVSTPKGIMTHHKAKEMGLGGRLIAYCY